MAGRSQHLSRQFCFGVLTIGLCACASVASLRRQRSDASEAQSVALTPGKKVERELAGGQTHDYQVALSQGQHAKVIVEQRGIDVMIRVSGPDGKQIADFDSEIRRQGIERVDVVAESAGDYRLDVKAKYPRDPAAAYQIELAEIRTATELDRDLFEAHKLDAEAINMAEAARYDEAKKLENHAIELGNKAAGPEDPYVASMLSNLGRIEFVKAEYAEAEQTLTKAVAIFQKAHGDAQTVLPLIRLGSVYTRMGNYVKSEQALQQALDVAERALGKEHPLVESVLQQFASLHSEKGDFERASQETEKALEIAQNTLQKNDFILTQLVNNLGDIYVSLADYDRAEPLCERALKEIEEKFGPNHVYVAYPLQNLGIIARQRKDYKGALDFFLRAEAVREKALGVSNPQTTALLVNIANVYHSQGDYAKAIELSLRALGIFENTAGPYHRFTFLCLLALARDCAAEGDEAKALEYEQRVNAVLEKNIAMNMAADSEREKLDYMNTVSDAIERTISLNVGLGANDPAVSRLASLEILQRKGRILDAMSNDLNALRQRLGAGDQKMLDDWNAASIQLAKLSFKGAGKTPSAEYRTQLASAEERRDKLEAEIALRSSEFRAQSQTVTLDAVQSDIPPDAALIEFVVYRRFNPKAPTLKEYYGDARYIAYVLRHKSDPQWKDLGPAKQIDDTVTAFRQALRDPKSGNIKPIASALYQKVIEPISSLLGSATHLLISPDGELNLVPFEAFVDSRNEYLVQHFSITYLTSGRDLLRFQVRQVSKNPPLVIADPMFDKPQISDAGGPSERMKRGRLPSNARRSVTNGETVSDLYFAPLDATALEAEAIKSLFPDARVLTGPGATESALEQVDAPRILHIATHGFFLRDPGPSVAEEKGTRNTAGAGGLSNPMLRSGLALAGANLRPTSGDTGLLTALEASGLNLWGTKLVTLSACDTGIGEIRNGEGVYGLRRAFILAGAETLIMSLWPVSDYATRQLMTGYYKNLKLGIGRGESLRQIQLEMLKRKDRQHPYYWASFIQTGEWANLDGRR